MTSGVLVQVTVIRRSEISGKTSLGILDFLSDESIIVVEGGLINESFVEGSLQKEIEVGHNTGVVSELVLLEDRLESVESFGAHDILRGLDGEARDEFEDGKEGNTPGEGQNTGLYKGDKQISKTTY